MKNDQNITRLPLWKECVKDMKAQGIAHGKIYDSGYFEEQLRCKRDCMAFALAIAEIRRALEEDGFYLSGRGQKGDSFVVVPPENNADVMQAYGRKAADALMRAVILGTNTRLDLLAPADRRRHEAILEKMAIKSILLQRSAQIAKALPDSAKKLLSV